jgi:hypothetical protein
MSERGWREEFDRAQLTRTANVACIKWGTRYGPEWVNRLYGMVRRNTTWGIRFVCFTDDASGIRPEVECQPLPEVRLDPALGKNWRKVGLMQKGLGGLEGMTLFLDLDLVVIGSLDPLFSYPGRFCIIREWKNPEQGYGNSSVMRYFIGMESAVLDRFYATPTEVLKGTFASKEQNFVSKSVAEVTFWPADWCVPFGLACLPRNRVIRFFSTPKPPPGGKILVFFGRITPESAMRGEHEPRKRAGPAPLFRPTRRRFRPAPWIGEHWRE